MSKRKVKDEVPNAENAADEPPKKRSKGAAKPKEAVIAEPYVDSRGWHVHPPSLLYKSWKAKPRSKIAGFDLDGTLVNTKSSAQFPRTADDWKWYNKKVAATVQDYHEKGFQVVIFSNQGGIKSKLDGKMAEKVTDRVEQVVGKLNVPAVALLATLEDDLRKPGTGMWKFFVDHLHEGRAPDLKASFFCGDAAGRPEDFADSDKLFAEAVGLPFKTPEEVFGEPDGKKALPTPASGASYTNVNEELVTIFTKLAENNTREGKGFQARAFTNVADVLSKYPKKVDNSSLPEVKKLKGIGKGSLSVIQEWLTTGKVEALGEGGAEVAAATKEARAATTAAKSDAMKFM